LTNVDSHDVRREWADRSGAYSPAYYAHYGPDETSEAIRELLARTVGREASVLELGCSSGRHLEHLRADGFSDLHGVELNAEAFDVMAEHYPDLRSEGTFSRAAIEDVVGGFADDEFAAIYAVETLQHVHPDERWVFAELARITGRVLVTVENEGGEDADEAGSAVNYVNGEFPLYYRDWEGVFTDLGLRQVEVRSMGRDTLRAFRDD
jgi:SAM-dependent methyltransferase